MSHSKPKNDEKETSAGDHVADDELQALVEETVASYLEAEHPKDKIKRTQLAALVRITESEGGKGLRALIKDYRAKIKRNNDASRAGKGGKKAKNELFWETMKKVVEGPLQKLLKKTPLAEETYIKFVSRLAIEIQYQRAAHGR